MFPENIGIKGFSGWIVSFWPLRLPVCVTQYGSPFANGKRREVTLASFLECTTEEEEMVIKNALVLFTATPKEMNGGEGEPSSLGWGMELDVIDVAHGSHPDLLYFRKPRRCSSNIGEASKL